MGKKNKSKRRDSLGQAVRRTKRQILGCDNKDFIVCKDGTRWQWHFSYHAAESYRSGEMLSSIISYVERLEPEDNHIEEKSLLVAN